MKTVASKASVSQFIATLENPDRRRECRELVRLMRRVTGKRPVMWGDSIVGFDVYGYQRANGQAFEFFRTGFSPRKQALTLYIMPGYADHAEILTRLGPHRIGKSCLYLKRLSDVDPAVLEELVSVGYADMNDRYPH
jgi:hypothetical protein